MRHNYGVYTLFVLSIVIGVSNSFFLWGMNKSPPTEANLMYKIFKSSSIIEMFKNTATGKYYVNMHVGNNWQEMSVLIDTLSDKTYIKCKELPTNDKHKTPKSSFDFKASSTYKPLSCKERFLKFYCNKPGECQNNTCVSKITTNSGSAFGTNVVQESVGFKAPIGIQLGPNVPIKKEKMTTLQKLLTDQKKASHNQNKAEKQLEKKRRRLMRIISYKNLKKNTKELAILKRIINYSNKKGMPTERALQNCVQDPKFLQSQSESGTLGIAPNTDSKDITPSPIDSQFQYKHIRSKNFSLCFSDIGGFFSLGGLNTSKHLKKTLAIQVPYEVIENKYAIKIYDVKAGDYKSEKKVKSSKFNSGYFIINSNSEETIFNGDQFYSLKDKFDKFCKSYKGACAGNTSLAPKNYCAEYNTQNHQGLDAFYKLFPNQYFKMESNKQFVWFPFDYLKKENTKDGKVVYCTQFRVAEGTEASSLGTSFMKHYDFFFDRINSKLIIFRSTCDEKDNDVAARVLANDPRKAMKKIISPYAKVSIS